MYKGTNRNFKAWWLAVFFSLIDCKDDLEVRIQPWSSELPTSVNSDTPSPQRLVARQEWKRIKGLFTQ